MIKMFYIITIKNTDCFKCHLVHCSERNNFRFRFVHKFFCIEERSIIDILKIVLYCKVPFNNILEYYIIIAKYI